MVAEQVSRSMEQESSGLTKSACELTSDRDPVNAELPAVVKYLDELDDVCVAKTIDVRGEVAEACG